MRETSRNVAKRLRDVATRCDGWTVRVVRQTDEVISVRRSIVEPAHRSEDFGAMIHVSHDGGVGYTATSELTSSGLEAAFRCASGWARRAGAGSPPSQLPQPVSGSYTSPVEIDWAAVPRAEKIARLLAVSEAMAGGDRVVDWSASLWRTSVDSLLVGSDGGENHQRFDYLVPRASVTASDGKDSQTRTFGGHAYARQGGMEVADAVRFWECGPRLREQALGLLGAENCPTGRMPVVLAPDQMILQIHESIGHPIELDRILGDERNYAGGSFVSLDMVGSYRYGSDLLNVTFDPAVAGELASYGFDDEGQGAQRTHVIRDGILVRTMGGARSQGRAGVPGVANARANGWNRPPIDRIANLNVEPGKTSFEDLVGGIESGLYMETNRSWSIDDCRNKFQFGCEYGRRVRDGKLAEVVKNPNYRGLSASFWRSLDGVGDESTVEVLGTPFCGKGEPNQVIRVGHASPACRFRDVDVFGGE